MLKYQIYDSKAQSYAPPFYCVTQGVALRMFTQAANDLETSIGLFPADYTLFETATWDPHTGKEEAYQADTNLGVALQYVSKASEAPPTQAETPGNPEANQRSNFPVKVSTTP